MPRRPKPYPYDIHFDAVSDVTEYETPFFLE